MALPRANRLRRRQDFDLVYQKGVRRKGSHLTLRALRQGRKNAFVLNTNRVNQGGSQDDSAQPTRIGISIGQKVSKQAVIRNRIKRQLKAIFRQLLPSLHSGWDVVVVVHPQAVQCDYCEFLQELEQLLINAEVFNGHS